MKMTMYKTIADAQLRARKDKDGVKASLLTTILGEFARGQTKEQPTDAQVFSVLTKMQNSIQQSIDASPTDALLTERAVVEELLALKPAAASLEEMEKIATEFMTTNENVNQGLMMKHLKATFGDRLDGKAANVMVSKLLFLSR